MRDQLLKWQNLKSMVLFTFFNDKESEADRRKDVFQERIVLEKATHTLFYKLYISEPPLITPFSFGIDSVDEGEFVQVTCNVRRGDLPLSVSWSLEGDTISSEPAITTTMIGVRTSILMISSVGYRHNGKYTCISKNDAGTSFESTILKVNGLCNIREREREDKEVEGSLFFEIISIDIS